MGKLIFDQDRRFEIVGKKIGYVIGYFIFTTILFYVLHFMNKLPRSWSYVHVMGITISIAMFAVIVKRLLK